MDTLKFKVLARNHNWVAGCIITESIERELGMIRRFTATIDGWRNWKIYQGMLGPGIDGEGVVGFVIAQVQAIQKRIREGDETIFDAPNEYATEVNQ